MFNKRQPRATFENGQTSATAADGFEDQSGAGDSGRNSSRQNSRAAGILRNSEQGRAAVQLHLPSGFPKAVKGVRAETNAGEIDESKLGTRIASGLDGGALAQVFVQDGAARRRIDRQEVHFANHLRDASVFLWRFGGNGVAAKAEGRKQEVEDERSARHEKHRLRLAKRVTSDKGAEGYFQVAVAWSFL